MESKSKKKKRSLPTEDEEVARKRAQRKKYRYTCSADGCTNKVHCHCPKFDIAEPDVQRLPFSPVESMACKIPWVVVNKSLLSISLVYIEERRMAAAVGSFAGVGGNGVSSPSSEANDEFRAVSSCSCCSARMSSVFCPLDPSIFFLFCWILLGKVTT